MKITSPQKPCPGPRKVHLISNRDPFSFEVSGEESQAQLNQTRWRTLLENFTVVYYCHDEDFAKPNPLEQHKPDKTTSSEKPRDWEEINKACRGNKTLISLKEWLMTTGYIQHLNDEEFIQHFATLARPHYESIWNALSLNEQLALFHLARDRFIHVHHPGIPSLLQRGIIRFDPDLRLMNTTFREFVRNAAIEDGLEIHENQQAGSLWSAIKRPLTVMLVGLLGFFLITQQEFRAALPALLTFIPILIQSFSEMSKSSKIP